MSDLFEGLDVAMADRLKATDYFLGPPATPVVVKQGGDLLAAIEAVFAKLSAGGCLVTVFPPQPLSPPPSSDEEACEVEVHVGEKFLLSRQSTGGERTVDERSARRVRGIVLATLRQQEVEPWGLLTLAREETEDAQDGRLTKLTFTARLLVLNSATPSH